jgi:DNA polymerase III sliding clamp (beta) subunit (PCNA family)
MQIGVERLRETLNLLKPVVPKKKTGVPITQNILLQDGKAMATDLEVMVILDLPEAEGACLIPHDSVLELLKHLPGYERLTINTRRGTMKFSWDGGEASYDAASPQDYPPVPELSPVAESNINGDTMVQGLSSVVAYCATASDRPTLCGVHFFLGEEVAVGASDGFRLAYQKLPLSFPARETAIIPTRAVAVLAHLWEKIPPAPSIKESLIEQITAERELNLAVGDGRLRATFDRVTLITQLIKGASPEYLQVIPKEEEITSRIRVFAPEFEQAVHRASGVANDGKGILRLTWTESTLTVSAQSADKGKVEANVPAMGEAVPGRIALSVNYLLDYLRGKQGIVTIGIKNQSSPILFHHGTSPLVLIMPMFVEW